MKETPIPPSETPAPLAVRWAPRSHPLPADAAASWGRTAIDMAGRLLLRDDSALARLSGLAAGDILIFIGPADDLPWADGVRYLGRDPIAPSILIPTTLTTSVPITLFERAIASRSAGAAPPLAVLPERGAIISLSAAEPLSRAKLIEWLGTHGDTGHPPNGAARRRNG